MEEIKRQILKNGGKSIKLGRSKEIITLEIGEDSCEMFLHWLRNQNTDVRVRSEYEQYNGRNVSIMVASQLIVKSLDIIINNGNPKNDWFEINSKILVNKIIPELRSLGQSLKCGTYICTLHTLWSNTDIQIHIMK